MTRLARIAALAALVAAPASAQECLDFLCLKDGRAVQGRKLLRAEGGVEIVFENGKVLVPSALIGDFWIEGEPPPEPANEEERAQLAKGYVRFEGKWISTKRRDDLLRARAAERKQALEAMAGRREWRNRASATTKHFAFEHTLPDEVFGRYRDLMEAYFETFVRDWKIKLPRDLGPLKVCLHIDHDSMVQVGGAGPGVLGYFRFVRPMELNFFHDRLDPAFTEEVMFHETNHYLQKLLDLDFSMPHFPGESLAEYYGASRWDQEKKKLTVGLILEERLCEVQGDIDLQKWMGLERLVTTEGMYEHYNWGWSLVHFLMSTPAHTKKFQKFVVGLPSANEVRRNVVQAGGDTLKTVEQADVWRWFCKCLDLDDADAVGALEKEWHAYVKERLEVVTFRGYEQAAQRVATMNPPRPIKAKRLFQTAIDLGTQNPLTFHRFAMLLSSEGELDRAIGMWREAIARDPLRGEFYGHLGRALARKGQKEEGERLRKLAVEIDPDDPWALLDDLADDDDKDG